MNTPPFVSLRTEQPHRIVYSSAAVWSINALLISVSITLPSSALASSFLLPKNVMKVPVGSTFPLPIVLDPAGEKQYTARLNLTYPDTLEVVSFQFAPVWVPVSQPGYDSLDHPHGELVKTAGFPQGLTAVKPFGIVTFRAAHAGVAVISVGTRSFILNAESTSTLESRSQVQAIITEKPIPVLEHPSAIGSEPLLAEPLRDEPSSAQNLFDIRAEPQKKEEPQSIPFFVGLLLLGLLLGLAAPLAYAYGMHRWAARKQQKP